MPIAIQDRRNARTAVLAVALAAACCAAVAQQAPQSLPMLRLNAGIHNIQAELAQTPEQRSVGLMHRPSMDAPHGMLFAFEQAATQCFWMKNTLLPLSIAFVADDGTVVNIADMAPQTTESHCSAQPVRYALEMNRGWFAKRGVKPGSRLSGAPFRN